MDSLEDRIRNAVNALEQNERERGGYETVLERVQAIFPDCSEDFIEGAGKGAYGIFEKYFHMTGQPNVAAFLVLACGFDLGKRVGEGAVMERMFDA